MSETRKDALIAIGGAGGFIAGALVRYFHDRGFTRIRAIELYQEALAAHRWLEISAGRPLTDGDSR